MCRDCATWRTHTRGVAVELLADLLLPLVLYALPLACLLWAGVYHPF